MSAECAGGSQHIAVNLNFGVGYELLENCGHLCADRLCGASCTVVEYLCNGSQVYVLCIGQQLVAYYVPYLLFTLMAGVDTLCLDAL